MMVQSYDGTEKYAQRILKVMTVIIHLQSYDHNLCPSQLASNKPSQ